MAKSKSVGYVNRFTGELERLRTPDSVRVGVEDVDCQSANDGMTEQHHEADCNINNIVKRHNRDEFMAMLKNGIMAFQGMVFGDMSETPTDYQSSLNFVNTIDMKFAALPAQIRASYDNDAGKFMDAVKRSPQSVFDAGQAILATTLADTGVKLPVEPVEGLKKEAPVSQEKK